MAETKEIHMLYELMCLLPSGYTTNCKTAQLKTVQHHAFDTPKDYWCCWVKNPEGVKQFVLYNPNNQKIKILYEDEKKGLIVKPSKNG